MPVVVEVAVLLQLVRVGPAGLLLLFLVVVGLQAGLGILYVCVCNLYNLVPSEIQKFQKIHFLFGSIQWRLWAKR